MSMRSTVFRSGQHRVDTSLIEPDNLKQSCNFTANVLSTIHNSENHQHPRNNAKISRQSVACGRDQSPTRREEENWETRGTLTLPSTKQMGAEGSLNKSKSLFLSDQSQPRGKDGSHGIKWQQPAERWWCGCGGPLTREQSRWETSECEERPRPCGPAD